MAKSRKKDQEGEAENVPYGEAVQEIETILSSIDRDEVDVDELSDRVERAVMLIRLCQEKLRATEMRVTSVLGDLEKDLAARDRRPSEKAQDAVESTPPGPSSIDSFADSVADLEEDDELPF